MTTLEYKREVFALIEKTIAGADINTYKPEEMLMIEYADKNGLIEGFDLARNANGDVIGAAKYPPRLAPAYLEFCDELLKAEEVEDGQRHQRMEIPSLVIILGWLIGTAVTVILNRHELAAFFRSLLP